MEWRADVGAMPEKTGEPLCLLFDSDGTLVDSEILLAEVMGEILPAFDLPFSARQYLEEFRGVRFRTIVDTLGKRHSELRRRPAGRVHIQLLPDDAPSLRTDRDPWLDHRESRLPPGPARRQWASPVHATVAWP
ncbi:HAD hydrolase-like protein [Halomonas sp. LBP4]|uniref:HAD hydrolase-like protein n=1 Tax=Halomonas sp. LBP4 TaxID=2044917 RepID=UPI0035A0FE78